jgi:hypothetical protein
MSMDYRKPGTVEVVYTIPAGTADHTHPFVTGPVRPGPNIAVQVYGDADGAWMADVQYAKVRKDGSTSVTVGEVSYSGGGPSPVPQYVTDAVAKARTVRDFAFRRVAE